MEKGYKFKLYPNAAQELFEQVYCTQCKHLSLSEDEISYPYSSRCMLWNPEDSAPRQNRPCYAPSNGPVSNS